MMQRDDIVDRYADVLERQPAPAVARLVATLDAAGAPGPAPQAARIDAAMAHAMYAQPTAESQPARQRRVGALMKMRARLAAAAAAALLVMGGAVGYQQFHGVAPASAQSVLSRAAAAMRLAPNEAAHLVYSVSVTPPSGSVQPNSKAALMDSLTSDVWVQADASGAPSESAQTLDLAAPNQGSPDRYIQIGQQVYAYDRGHNAILISPGARSEQPSWVVPNDALDGAGVTQELSALAQRSPQQVRLLPRQTLNGNTVDVIQVDGWTDRPGQRTTFYFDTQSYLLRGFDAVGIDPTYPMPSWQVRLESYTTVAASAAPAGTFALNAPADARVVAPQPDPAVFAAVCHSANTMKEILKGGTQSLLAACQATAPTTTVDSLVSALISPFRSMLTSAMAAGQITQTQEVLALAEQQQWLRAFVTSPGGGAASSQQ